MKKKQENTVAIGDFRYAVRSCPICGAPTIWLNTAKVFADPDVVEWVPPIPGKPVQTVYNGNGWDYEATVGEDIPDHVEDVGLGFLRHVHFRRPQAETGAEDEYIQEELPF